MSNDDELVEAMAPRGRWILPAGAVVAATSFCMVGWIASLAIMMGALALFLFARVANASDRALGIAFAGIVLVCGGGGFVATMELAQYAAEQQRARDEAMMNQQMSQLFEEASRHVAEELATDAGLP